MPELGTKVREGGDDIEVGVKYHIDNIEATRKIAVVGNHDRVNQDLTTIDWIQGLQVVNVLNITEIS